MGDRTEAILDLYREAADKQRPRRVDSAFARLCEHCGQRPGNVMWSGTQHDDAWVCDGCHDTLEMEE